MKIEAQAIDYNNIVSDIFLRHKMTCLPSKCDSSESIYEEKLPALGEPELAPCLACYKSVTACQNVIKINITWERAERKKG